MELNDYDLRMFDQARIEAEKSDYYPFKLGCVISYKGRIIGRGRNSNKSHPLMKKYNRKYRHFNCARGEFISDSLHAEMSAILDVPFAVGKDIDWSKASIYVYRICHGKPHGYGMSKPCKACMAAIRDIGIKNVYFTSDDGLCYLRLE